MYALSWRQLSILLLLPLNHSKKGPFFLETLCIKSVSTNRPMILLVNHPLFQGRIQEFPKGGGHFCWENFWQAKKKGSSQAHTYVQYFQLFFFYGSQKGAGHEPPLDLPLHFFLLISISQQKSTIILTPHAYLLTMYMRYNTICLTMNL